jgi:hypothetical protein
MNITIRTILTLTALFLLAGPVWADENPAGKMGGQASDPVRIIASLESSSITRVEAKDEQLDIRKVEFFRFAQEKIREMNHNHNLSRERMQISKAADGSCRAVYHQIDDTSMAYEVSRSQSKSIPYVAVLSYREEVYAASCPTPEQCRQEQFAPVGYIPNRHIFSYSNSSWN